MKQETFDPVQFRRAVEESYSDMDLRHLPLERAGIQRAFEVQNRSGMINSEKEQAFKIRLSVLAELILKGKK